MFFILTTRRRAGTKYSLMPGIDHKYANVNEKFVQARHKTLD